MSHIYTDGCELYSLLIADVNSLIPPKECFGYEEIVSLIIALLCSASTKLELQ